PRPWTGLVQRGHVHAGGSLPSSPRGSQDAENTPRSASLRRIAWRDGRLAAGFSPDRAWRGMGDVMRRLLAMVALSAIGAAAAFGRDARPGPKKAPSSAYVAPARPSAVPPASAAPPAPAAK